MESIYNSLIHTNLFIFPRSSNAAGSPTMEPDPCPCWVAHVSDCLAPSWPLRLWLARIPASTSARPAMWAAKLVPSSGSRWPRPSKWKSHRTFSAFTWAAPRSSGAWSPATAVPWACRTSCGTKTAGSCPHRAASRTPWLCLAWVARTAVCTSAWCDDPKAIRSRPPPSCNWEVSPSKL